MRYIAFYFSRVSRIVKLLGSEAIRIWFRVFSFTLFRTKAAKKHGSLRCSALGKIRGDVIIGQPTKQTTQKRIPQVRPVSQRSEHQLLYHSTYQQAFNTSYNWSFVSLISFILLVFKWH